MENTHRILMFVVLGVIAFQLYQIKSHTKNIGRAYACPAYGYEVSS